MTNTIIFTGGGSAGHVTPNIALIHYFQKKNWNIHYVGSEEGIEKSIIEKLSIPYHAISTGKLRRQLTFKNLLTPLKVMRGIIDAFRVCQKIKPDIIFSKGGFVAFPIVFSGWLRGIPIIAHESDLTPGLANRMSFPFCRKICVTFPEGKSYFKSSNKVIVTGTPVRDELRQGNRESGLALCGFNDTKPVLMVYGGGLGSEKINQTIRSLLPSLLDNFQVAHLCGKNKTDDTLKFSGYKQFEYVNETMPDIYACADIVVSRAGANSIYELLTLKKKHLLIPLSKKASRGDQIVNAQYFEKLGLSRVLLEENMTSKKLNEEIMALYDNSEIKTRLENYLLPDAVNLICQVIEKEVSSSR